MKEFWDQRYKAPDFAYGLKPNQFLEDQLSLLRPGRILFPGEGEGRNAVFAAKIGWEVDAFDWSEEAKNKATNLAASSGVSINYQVGDLADLDLPLDTYDALALIFVHFPANKRKLYHRRLVQSLRPGGYVLLEGFSKDHIRWNSQNARVGGPKDPSMLFSREELEVDFEELEFCLLEEIEVELDEGLYHVGTAAVIRFVGKKK